jgi:dTDP-4-amino-4,6-dideoxygalactose transaminase
MSMDLLEEKLRKKPKGFFKAVVVVDFAGHPADLVRLKALGETYGFSIIEDACHALGAEFRDSTGTWRKCGDCSFADIAVLSFHPVKHITTGEGGMLLTNSSALNERAKLLRTHGITKDAHLLQENHGGWYYEMQELGYNYRISDFQCALGLSQLDRLESGNARRREIAAIYDEGLLELPIDLSAVSPSIRHAYHLYVIETDRRRDLYDYLKRHDILAQVHYVPVNMMPYYRRLGHAPEATPNALAYYSRCLSLPMFPGLTGQEQEYVIEKIRAFYTSV